MRPMLDDLELPQVQDVTDVERRVLAEHKPPGMSGSFVQNLGRQPALIVLRGVAAGPDAAEFIQKLADKFRAAKPVPFTTDILADAKIDAVIIADLRVDELAGRPDRFAYQVSLREHIEPAEPAVAEGAGLDDLIGDEARGLIDDLAGALDLAPAFNTGLERFVGPLGDLLARVQKARGGG